MQGGTKLVLNVYRSWVGERATRDLRRQVHLPLDALDDATLTVRLERWHLGAEHAGWKFGWRDAPTADDVRD